MAEQQHLYQNIAVTGNHPGILSKLEAAKEYHPNGGDAQAIRKIGLDYGVVAFYRSGPTASLSMFAKCPNGIAIFGKKFSSIASALEYKKCEIAGCSSEELDKFLSLDGEASVAYSNDLTNGKSLGNWQNQANGVMLQIIGAKYAQNMSMVLDLKAAFESGSLLFHAPEDSTEDYWSDGGDGKGQNVFGEVLEDFASHLSHNRSEHRLVQEVFIPHTENVKELLKVAQSGKPIRIESTGLTAALSMHAKSPNGIIIGGEKFPCIAAALDYQMHEKFGSSKFEQKMLQNLCAIEAILYSTIDAHYMQNREMLDALGATRGCSLESSEDGTGINLFGQVLARWRDSMNWNGFTPEGKVTSVPLPVAALAKQFDDYRAYPIW